MNALIPEPPQTPAEFTPPALLADPPAAPGGLDMARLLRALLRGLPVIAAFALLGIGLGIVGLRMQPAQYTSTVAILIDPKDPGTFGAAGEFAGLAVDEQKIADVEQILLSTALLEKIVRARGLDADPRFGAASDGLLHRASQYLRTGHVTAPLDTPEARTDRAVAQLQRMIRVARVGMTYVMTVSVTADSAGEARDLAATIGDTYISDQVEAKYAAARGDAAWLEGRLAQLGRQLTASEAQVEAIRKQYGMVQTGNAPGATLDRQRMGELNAELARAEADVAQTGARYAAATAARGADGGAGTLADFSSSKLIETLRDREAEARQKLADLSVRYAADHPQRREAEQSVAAISHQIDIALAGIASGLHSEYAAALARRATLQAELNRLIGRESDHDNSEGRVALREAERIAEVNQTTYQATLNRLRDVQQQESRQEPEARIISAAQLPQAPSAPKPVLCLGLGLVFGLLAGAGAVILRALLHGRIEDAEHTERTLRVPVLATVPALRRGELAPGGCRITIPDYLLRNPFSAFAESLRRLRLNLRMALPAGTAVVQVTSAAPQEGKSTVAASLAVSYAQVGLRTLLIDLDVHHPAVAGLMPGSTKVGVTDLLIGTATAETALVQHPVLPLWHLPAGDTRHYRPGLLEGDGLRKLLAGLAPRFDIVLLDTAPVLAVSDAQLVAGLADATVIVVGWGSTARSHVSRAAALLRNSGAPLAGLVLNRADLGRADRYGYLAPECARHRAAIAG